VPVLQKYKNYCCQATESVSHQLFYRMLTCFVSSGIVPHPRPHSHSHIHPHLHPPKCQPNLCSWSSLGSSCSAQEGLLRPYTSLRLRNSCEIKLNTTPIIPRSLPFAFPIHSGWLRLPRKQVPCWRHNLILLR